MNKENKSDAINLRQKAEDIHKKRELKQFTSLKDIDFNKLIHELEVHQIELELQNEELILATERAAFANDRFTELYDFAPSGYFTLTKEGFIIELNLNGAKMLGNDRSQLINKAFGLYITHESKLIFFQFLEKVFESNIKESCEITIINKYNKHEYFQLTGIASPGNEHCFVTAVDITNRKHAEVALKESVETYRMLFDSINDAVFVSELSEDGKSSKFIRVNNVACERLGYTKEELLSKSTFDINSEKTKPNVAILMNKIINNKHALVETEHLTKDGKIIPVEVSTNVTQFNDKTYLYSIARDITERKLSEALFKDIIEKNPMSIQILDIEGYPIQTNSAHNALFGAKPPASYSIFKDKQLLKQGFGKLFEQIKKGEIVNFPDSYYNVRDIDPSFPDHPFWTKAIGFTLTDINGTPEKIVLMHENITESKHAKELLNDIIEKNPISIQIVDKDGYTLKVNPSFIKLFGAMPPTDFSIFEDLKEKGFKDLIEQVREGEVIQFPDVYYNIRDTDTELLDKPVWIRAILFPLKDNYGKLEHFVFMHENITERKNAEQDLIKSKEKAEESNRLKTAFLANMSHEIRTPMNGILGFADLLKEPKLTGNEQKHYISIIERSGQRMLNIINDIITISKIEAGSKEVVISEININDILEYIYTFFKPEAEQKGILLSFKNSLSADASIINSDKEKIYGILTNLVNNAIKFTDKGSIEYGCDIKFNNIMFYVKDSGIGVPIERQTAIFERFIKADIENKRAFQGAGLGLAISKSYIEILGGEIWLESEVGKGSKFYFTIPNDIKKEKGVSMKNVDEIAEHNNSAKKLKILIVENDEISDFLITKILKGEEYIFLHAFDGEEAIELYKRNHDIDLILMDIDMPVMDGLEATRQIKKLNKDLIIIAQSALALEGDKERILEAGCNNYLAKPINGNDLILMIKTYFGD